MILTSIITATASLWLTSAPTISVQPMAFTFHGLIEEDELKQIRDRGNTLDKEGRWTYHTGAGLMVRWRFIELQSIYFRNSFNMPAGAIMGGPKWSFGQYLSFGIALGTYVRKSIFGMRIPFSYQNKTFEIAPMAMVTASLAIPIYKHLYFEANVGSNYILNFFTPGIRMVF